MAATSTTTPSPTVVDFAPIEIIPQYLLLVSILHKRCKNIGGSDAKIVQACAALTLSTTKYREFINPLGSILPSLEELLAIKSLEFHKPRESLLKPKIFKAALKTFRKLGTIYGDGLAGDSVHGNFFNKDNQKNRVDKIEGRQELVFTEEDYLLQQFTILEQVRLSRSEGDQQRYQLKFLIITALIPQDLMLCLVIAQYLLLKKRARAAKKRNERNAREQQFLGRLMDLRNLEARQLE